MLPTRVHLAIATSVAIAHHATTQRPVTTTALEQHYRLPPRKLEQIVRTLVRAGVITSVRGAGGGYYVRKPEAITLADVVRASLGEKEDRAHMPPLDGLVAPYLARGTEALLAALAPVTLAQLVQDAAAAALFSLKSEVIEYAI